MKYKAILAIIIALFIFLAICIHVTNEAGKAKEHKKPELPKITNITWSN